MAVSDTQENGYRGNLEDFHHLNFRPFLDYLGNSTVHNTKCWNTRCTIDKSASTIAPLDLDECELWSSPSSSNFYMRWYLKWNWCRHLLLRLVSFWLWCPYSKPFDKKFLGGGSQHWALTGYWKVPEKVLTFSCSLKQALLAAFSSRGEEIESTWRKVRVTPNQSSKVCLSLQHYVECYSRPKYDEDSRGSCTYVYYSVYREKVGRLARQTFR